MTTPHWDNDTAWTEAEEVTTRARVLYEKMRANLERAHPHEFIVIDSDDHTRFCIDPDETVAELQFRRQFPSVNRPATFHISFI